MLSIPMFIATQVFILLFPIPGTEGYMVNREKEIHPRSSVKVSIHLNSYYGDLHSEKDSETISGSESDRKTLELPPESFSDSPVIMEEWMRSPKSWGKN
ncbi:MAG: hypothetical protein H6538_03895 [Bacteroidales bacterium]|nr:hypothetical protein [Bacteroidales bacterium]MCB8998694.1 hypothetical protein [Bacteroidales bacterium]